jgi:hypothetical protein
MYQIELVNQSTSIETQAVAAMIPALREQIFRDFAPLWGLSADLQVAETITPGVWTICVKDRCGESNDLGFHIDNAHTPMASVGVLDAKECQVELSTVISHELLEMLADPSTTRTIQIGANTSYMVEVCDAVSGDYYDIGGVKVSNFCTPRYFGYTQMGHFDQLGYLQAGCPTIRPGGMVMWWDGQIWNHQFGRTKEGALPWRAHYVGRSSWRATHTHSTLLG